MIFPLILASVLSATSPTAPATGDPNRQDNYETMLSCAAFHTIEATRSEGGASESQQAVAYDFATSAVRFAPDGKVETTNDDLERLLATFREKLDTGDVREVAEGWTSLESACRRLYPLRDELDKDAAVKAEAIR
jgi:hypothetical protein